MPNRYTRLTTPLVRSDGELRPASWDEALDRTAAGFAKAAADGAEVGLFQLLEGHERAQLRRPEAGSPSTATIVDSCNQT